jgi:hypothetical protein
MDLIRFLEGEGVRVRMRVRMCTMLKVSDSNVEAQLSGAQMSGAQVGSSTVGDRS